jgi:hypothetical protein
MRKQIRKEAHSLGIDVHKIALLLLFASPLISDTREFLIISMAMQENEK